MGVNDQMLGRVLLDRRTVIGHELDACVRVNTGHKLALNGHFTKDHFRMMLLISVLV